MAGLDAWFMLSSETRVRTGVQTDASKPRSVRPDVISYNAAIDAFEKGTQWLGGSCEHQTGTKSVVTSGLGLDTGFQPLPGAAHLDFG